MIASTIRVATMTPMPSGRLLQINVSDGGVPKRRVERARVGRLGVEGDRQRDETVHGGPFRAVSILGIEAIRRVASEGHPIAPGTTGENLTVEGFDVSTLPIGTRLAIGPDVILELSGPADPCRTIRHSFRDLRFGRLGVAAHPADSRMYARVVHEGTVAAGEAITVSPPADDSAERAAVLRVLERAERASSLAVWRAATQAGHRVEIVDDGELAIAAAPDLPGPAFNQALGFAGLPHLIDRAREHFERIGVTGWVWAAEPPSPGVEPDATAVYGAAAVEEVRHDARPDRVSVRELGREEVGPWASVVAEAAGLPPPVARAFGELEPHLAHVAHHHRFVAELDGRPVGAGSLHTHHGVGWLRAGTVLPEARGRGIQQLLIAERAAAAARLGCEFIGASANEGGTSARNLERVGARIVGVRARYRLGASTSNAPA
jgi:MOSC domain-containing protein YiiM/GNAT superfamily N-acetyltransferase